jgi:hypothetical protein
MKWPLMNMGVPLLAESNLDIGDSQTEEQVHDDNGHEEDEDGDEDVSGEGEVLRLGHLGQTF